MSSSPLEVYWSVYIILASGLKYIKWICRHQSRRFCQRKFPEKNYLGLEILHINNLTSYKYQKTATIYWAPTVCQIHYIHFQPCSSYLLYVSNHPKSWWFQTTIILLSLVVSVGQKFRRSGPGSSGSRPPMQLQSEVSETRRWGHAMGWAGVRAGTSRGWPACLSPFNSAWSFVGYYGLPQSLVTSG